MPPVVSMLALVALLVAPAVAAAVTAAVPVLGPDALHAGMRAEVRTVFEGQRVDTFTAEIVGVLHGGRAEGDEIIARATDPRVIRLGVAAGMSGSPVYVDGKLVGALSGGWSFVSEPLFVITPIGEMLAVLDHTPPSGDGASGGPSGIGPGERTRDLSCGPFRWSDDDAFATPPVSGPPVGEVPLALPLAFGGLSPAATAEARALFEPLGFRVTPGGRGHTSGGDDTLIPGSACAVDVLRGDLDASAIGTVTYRDGDRVLLFGHPFFQAGDVRLPLSTATITTIVPSIANPFKLGISGRPVGTVTEDRRAGVGGRLGASPSLLPFGVTVTGAGPAQQRFRFESIEDRQLMPQMVAIAALNCVLESGGASGDQTLSWRLTLYRAGSPPLTLGDRLAGDSPVGELPGAVMAPLRFLANNPYSRLKLDSLSLAVETRPGRDQWTLRVATLREAAVRPGGLAHVRCDLERWRGDRRRIELTVPVPEELPEGRYTMWVGGGAELDRFVAARLPGRFRPVSLDDAWRRLASMHRGDQLYGMMVARAPEVTRGGADYPELPNSAYALLAGPQLAGDDARRGDRALLAETAMPLDAVLRGELQLEVIVDDQAP
ncbi:MAG: SpoIVB peptidase S55 domain-containing protein [Candidatus Eisenbacteria bacterium]